VLDVPLSPPAIEGLINLRGTVTVLIDMGRVLGTTASAGASPAGDATRVIVLRGTRVGLRVDRVVGIVGLDAGLLERAGDGDAGFISGTVPGDGARPAISVLALDRVLGRVAARAARPAAAVARSVPGRDRVAAASGGDDTLMLVSFEAGGEEYAVPVSAVREVVRLEGRQEGKLARMPHGDGNLLGVATLRGRLVPLFDLRGLLGLETGERADAAAARIIVLSFNGVRAGLVAGLVVDRAREILRVGGDLIDPVPPLFRQDSGEIEAICRLDGGRRLVSVLDPERLFQSEAVSRGQGPAEDDMGDDRAGAALAAAETFVIFRLGGVEYGLPSSGVEQVLAVPERLTEVPKAPAFIEGVINHRGAVLPVIDQRRRFAMPPAEIGRGRRIIVVAMGAVRAGLLVDGVTGVLRIAADAIEPAPDLSPEQMALISRVANLAGDGDGGGRMVLLLDPAHLLDRREADALSGMDA
jgi:purine-binding chemotaxis protein CheW